MEDRKHIHGRGWTGLAKHGATVSLAPARAVSSHARRLYRARYAGRYRYARFIFAFDLLLLAVVGILAVFSLNLLYRDYMARPVGLGLSLEAPPIKASEVLPVQLTVKSTDGQSHDGVVLRWHLPAWVETVEAYPPLAADGSLNLGTVKPGSEKHSRLLVKVRAPVGEKVPFGFTVTQYDPLLLALSYSGGEARAVEKAALTVRAAVPGAAYLSGASVPLIVENAGRSAVQAVTLRLASRDGAAAATLGKDGNFSLGDLAPGAKRLVFADLGKLDSDRFSLGFELQDAAQVVQAYRIGAEVASGCALRVDGLAPDGAGFSLAYEAGGKARLLADGGSASDGKTYQDIELGQTSGTYRQAVSPGDARGSWDVVPIDLSGPRPCVGRRLTAAATDALPATAEARYYALTGDQLGVGPLPPVVGEKTTYWVVWSIGPFSSNLKDVRLVAALPPGVAATGKYSSAVSGGFDFSDTTVGWRAAELKLAGAEKTNVAFEVELRPRAEQVGSAAPLLGKTSVKAVTEQGDGLDFELPAVDTELTRDERAQGKGTVVGR